MDLRQLLGKLTVIEGSMEQAAKQPTGPKYTGQWRGTDAGTPGKKLVGSSEQQEESILKDLSKGPTPKTKEQDLAEQFESFLAQLEEDNLGVEEKRPARKGSRPEREYEKTGQPSKRYTTVKEHGDQEDYEPWGSQDLKSGEKALKGKPVKAKAAGNLAKDALNTAFGGSAKELTKNLSIRKDIDEETENQQDFLYKVVCDGYDKGNFVNKNDAIFSGQYMIYYGEKEYNKIQVIELSTGNVIWEWTGEKDTEAPPTESPASKVSQAQAHYEDVGSGKERCGNCKFFEDPHGCSKVEGEISPAGICDLYAPVATDESRGHKVVATKLKDIERAGKPADDELKAREAQARADYAKYVAKMKKLNPNYIPMYKMDEAGANNPPQQNIAATPAQPNQQQQAQQLKNVSQGTQALKAAVGSTAPTDVLAKAIDTASQGTAIDAKSAQALEPMMDVIKQAAQDPNLANQFKSLASQAKTSASKQPAQPT